MSLLTEGSGTETGKDFQHKIKPLEGTFSFSFLGHILVASSESLGKNIWEVYKLMISRDLYNSNTL